MSRRWRRRPRAITGNFSGDSETLELTYRTVSTVTDPFAPPETLCAQLQEHQRSHARAELESAQCLSGPHKDDFEAVINGLPVAQFASQGQTRTAVTLSSLPSAPCCGRERAKRPCCCSTTCCPSWMPGGRTLF